MVQMSAADQAIVKALPGNSQCCDCGMKSPQWASVSFGTVFCLECSGVHRSLGVHISFVRSIAMDSWNDKQLALMKAGGNKKCNEFLKKHNIDERTPIKQKYESPAAQLYKEVLKARAEGRPEPTELPKQAPVSGNRSSSPAAPKAGEDPYGMERLTGETDQQYIARQTRLREEAKARMAAKFGGGGGGMGGVGSGGSRMGGIGSDPTYNPHASYGGLGVGGGVDSLVSGMGSALSFAGNTASSVTQSVSSFVTDEQNINTIKATAGGFWGSLSSTVNSTVNTVNTVASNIVQPDQDDGLAQLQREMASHKPSTSKYAGFGSSNNNAPPSTFDSFGASNSGGSGSSGAATPPPASGGGGGGGLQEAPGLPGEDRDGIERLTGESDEQYIMRQTRLREEARARMAAKFGSGGLSSAASSSASSRPPTAPASAGSAAAQQQLTSAGSRTPPRAATPPQAMNSSDFFASFGT